MFTKLITSSNIVPFSSRTEWVKIHGDKYARNMVVVFQQFIFPEFLKIHKIFIRPNMDVVFCCKKLQTIAYKKRMHCYEMKILNEFVSILHSCLLDHHPLDLYAIDVNRTQRNFLRMKYDLSDAEQ